MPEINAYEQIGEGLLEELERRLGTPELAQELPGTLLMNLVRDYVKYNERKLALEEEKLNQLKIDPLEMIDQPGLSLERRITILAEYLADLEDVWRRASDRMAEILEAQGGEANGNDSEVPEVPDVVPEGK